MDETSQEAFSPETEIQVTETVPVETDPVPSEEVPATTAATVPAPVSTYDPYEIIYGVDSSTESTTEPTQVVEVSETVGIPVDWELVDSHILGLGEALNLIAGMLLFFTVVMICYFVYKFFRIFF